MRQFRSMWIRLREKLTLPVLRRLVQWCPLKQGEPGYTLILGCNAALAKTLLANLLMVSRQDVTHLKEIIVILDRPRKDMPEDIESLAVKVFPNLPLRFIYYTPFQRRVAAATRSPWVYCWLSWCIGVAQTTTRYAFLHDFDAMLIEPTFLEKRYQAIQSHQATYVGLQQYNWGDIPAHLGFVQTFEMIFDVEFLRGRFEPVDMFNRLHEIQGRRLLLDTFLLPQALAGKRVLIEATESDLIHPGQMICQFQSLQIKNSYVPPGKNNLLLIPYFLFLGGFLEVLTDASVALKAAREPAIPFFGRDMDLSRLDPDHVKKLVRQTTSLELAVVGAIRPQVSEYLNQLNEFVQRHAPASAEAGEVKSTPRSGEEVRATRVRLHGADDLPGTAVEESAN